jgi:LPS O-antigen subunit length determinant protein (WzzB/FepE family)
MNTTQLSAAFDLRAILNVVAERKYLALATFGVFLLGGLLISSMVSPIYRAQVQLLPPTENELRDLIVGSSVIGRSTTPEIFDLAQMPQIFQRFKWNLGSRTHQSEFLKKNAERFFGSESTPRYVFSSADGFKEKVPGSQFAAFTVDWEMLTNRSLPYYIPIFIKNSTGSILRIRVDTDKINTRTDLVVSVSWHDPEIASIIANEYVEFVSRVTVLEVIDLVQSGIEMYKDSLWNFIEQQRKIARSIEQDDILKLEAAIHIAKSLDIRKPTNVFGDYNVVHITPPAQYFETPSETKPYNPNYLPKHLPLYNPGHLPDIKNNSLLDHYSPPLYSRGWQALELELQSIKNRNHIDPYIPNMRQLLAAFDWIKSTKFNPDSIRSAKVTQSAFPSDTPIGWGKFHVLSITILLGVITSIFLPLALNVVIGRYPRQE